MRLTIRWKFILSIGLTLLVTYLALLSWDYRWQHDTAVLQMQDLVTERARNLAENLNERLTPGVHQAEALATAIERFPFDAGAQLGAQLQEQAQGVRPTFTMYAIIGSSPTTAPAAQEPTVYRITPSEPGRGRQGGREGREGARGAFRRGGPGRGQRVLPPGIEQIRNIDNRMENTFNRMAREPLAEWFPPRPENSDVVPGGGSSLFCRYVTPITINETFRGIVMVFVPVESLQMFAPPPPQFARGPTSLPATMPAELEEGAPRIIDNEGRLIWPPPPPQPGFRGGPRDQREQREPLVGQLEQRGLKELADDLRAAIAGESKVVRITGANELIEGAQPSESYFVALAPLHATGWVVTAALPESQFMNRIVDRLWQRGFFLAGGLIVLLGVVAVVSIRVSRPIERMATAVQQLAAGNLDAQVRGVHSRDEVGQLARAFNTMTGQLKQHIAALTEQTAARQSAEAELRIARQIQKDLLPRKFPPFPDRTEFELYAVNVPAKEVAGDFYDFFFSPNDLLTVAIADVAGKGMPAAMLMAVTRTIIRNLAMEGMDPRQICERANTMLVQDVTDSRFVTLFLCQYDTRTGKLIYVNAGHPKPYRIGPGISPEPFGEVTGAILGVNPNGDDWMFEQREGQLNPGETLLLYTDGVTEARAPDGEMLRDAGLVQLIERHDSESVDSLCASFVEELNRYQNHQLSDDLTVLALRRR